MNEFIHDNRLYHNPIEFAMARIGGTWKKLLYFAAQRTSEFADAENIVQDIFVSLWEKHGRLKKAVTAVFSFMSPKMRSMPKCTKQAPVPAHR